tara:strand:- start:209 stop:337 length:129 start_codon:yes stop_codon:yes gene_type:complete
MIKKKKNYITKKLQKLHNKKYIILEFKKLHKFEFILLPRYPA